MLFSGVAFRSSLTMRHRSLLVFDREPHRCVRTCESGSVFGVFASCRGVILPAVEDCPARAVGYSRSWGGSSRGPGPLPAFASPHLVQARQLCFGS